MDQMDLLAIALFFLTLLGHSLGRPDLLVSSSQ